MWTGCEPMLRITSIFEIDSRGAPPTVFVGALNAIVMSPMPPAAAVAVRLPTAAGRLTVPCSTTLKSSAYDMKPPAPVLLRRAK